MTRSARATRPHRSTLRSCRSWAGCARAGGDVAGMQAAFDEIVAAAPDNVAYRQLYTQALSDTLQYSAALQQGEQALALAQQQKLDTQAADIQKLLDSIRAKAGG